MKQVKEDAPVTVEEQMDLTSRDQLKAVRTAFNEYTLRASGDPGYFKLYVGQPEEQIVENLKAVIEKEHADDPSWLGSAPDIILLFALATGIITDPVEEDVEEEDVDAVEDIENAAEEDVEEEDIDDEIEPEEEEEEEEDADVDDVPDDGPEDIEFPSGVDEDDVVDTTEPIDANEAVIAADDRVYEIQFSGMGETSSLSSLLQSLAYAFTVPNIDCIVIHLKERDTVPQTPRVRPTRTGDLSPISLKSRMRFGGDLLHKEKRIAFIKEHAIPTKKDLRRLTPKELTEIIVTWATDKEIEGKA